MNITPETFAKLLKNSTLNNTDQLAILNLLPSLTEDQTAELANILKIDNKNQERSLKNATSKRDEILLKFKLELQSIENAN